jgi:DNA-binding IclR family transcriptional regulator
MRIDVTELRKAGGNDQAILDLLQLQSLGMAPGRASVRRLRELWGCHQSTVSRRMAAIAALGVCTVHNRWGSYTLSAERPQVARVNCVRPDASLNAMRWEILRERWREVTA